MKVCIFASVVQIWSDRHRFGGARLAGPADPDPDLNSFKSILKLNYTSV
jgi:hypothetical protein